MRGPFSIILTIAAVLYFAMVVSIMWTIGSTITSGIKALTNNCDKKYPVELVLHGHWFCPIKKKLSR